MKNVLQNLKNGKISIEESPIPKNKKGHLLIASKFSLISSGTERMLQVFGKANYLNKARQQPEKVREVLDKIKTDGLLSAYEAVRSKLDQPIPLGYSNVGIVIESDVKGFKVGDRVVSNGYHAEVVSVPANLCAKIPQNVDDETAVFTVLASIGLQGVRLINPTLGENIVVFGLGLIGLITAQLLKSNGCSVIGIDNMSSRCAIADSLGIETIDLSLNKDPIAEAKNFSQGFGVDGVLITASSTSNLLIHQAAEMCRQRGRIVLVGVTGLNLKRDDFYKKELTFQVSSSYGPGRYDPVYEEKGIDYPIGFVRWTEQRNFQAILDLMAKNFLNIKPLISKKIHIDHAMKAYDFLDDASVLGILIEYSTEISNDVGRFKSAINFENKKLESIKNYSSSDVGIGFIGAGNYASRTLIPAFKSCDADLVTLVTRSGTSGVHFGRKFGFNTTSTSIKDLLKDEKINTVVIATRHNDHANQVIQALKARKNVFVEKPLALIKKDLDKIESLYSSLQEEAEQEPRLMVGFNRRFAPLVITVKNLLDTIKSPKSFIMTINAGNVGQDHWIQDPNIGGGRILGEACHFIDLLRYLSGEKIVNAQSDKMQSDMNDTQSIHLTFADGSIGSIHYFSNGSRSYPKEHMKIFADGKVLEMVNFRKLRGYGWEGFSTKRLLKQNKGQANCALAFVKSIKMGQPSPIPFEEILEVNRISIDLQNS